MTVVLSAAVAVVPRRILLGVLAMLFSLSVVENALAQDGSSEVTVSAQLSNYLALTAQQKESIAKLNRQSGSKSEAERANPMKVHQEIVATLTVDQREKLKVLESPAGNTDLKAEARTLHLLCPKGSHRGFGGTTTKYSTSTCVEPGENKNSPPPSPPQ